MTGDGPWTVELSGPSFSYLKRLPQPDRERIKAKIDGLENGPQAAGAKRLEGRVEWSLRVGKFRLILHVSEKERTITVLSIGSRGDVYKRAKRRQGR